MEEKKIYNLNDYISTLKAGDLIRGFAYGEQKPMTPADGWYGWPDGCSLVPCHTLDELKLELLSSLIPSHCSENGVDVYVIQLPALTNLVATTKANKMLFFEKDKPIGLFLGNIFRCNGKTFVNILTGKAQNIWI